VPMGDMLERKSLIMIFTILSAIFCALCAVAPSFILVAAASLALGLASMTPQLIIPFAAHLSPDHERGKVVGTLLSGLLLGILLARTVSGFVGAAFGWRAMFGLASFILLILTAVLSATIPKSEPTFKGRYTDLLKSVIDIFRTQPTLREASLFGAMLFGSFSVFWANLIHLMQSPAFDLGARAVGLFGLLGAGAALATPWIGSLTDKKDPRSATGIMIGVTIISFAIFLLSGSSLIGLAIGVLVMDIGVQAGHLCNQSRIFALIPEARSRIQTAYMFCYFAGGAFGSFIGSWAWTHYQWTGVCGAALAMLSVALVRFFMRSTPRTSPSLG
jgi:predicted MFS family arabinose efflux permease